LLPKSHASSVSGTINTTEADEEEEM